MTATLKGFSQEVDLANPKDVRYVLVFEVDGTRTLRLPVPKETVETLMADVYGRPDVSPIEGVGPGEDDEDEDDEEEPEPEEDEDADYFGGVDESPPAQVVMQRPRSEDEIPSL